MAEAQIEIRDASGNIIVDRLTSCMRMSDQIIYTNGANGSVVDNVLTSGTPFFIIRTANNTDANVEPAISISGNVLTWTYSSGDSTNQHHFISMGAY